MRNLIVFIIGTLFLISCEGDRGPRGPVGPAGPSFEYTPFVFTINTNEWIEYEDGSGLYAEVNASEITYDILDYGYTLTFLNIGTDQDPRYVELPRTLMYTDSEGISYTEEIHPNYMLGKVRIEYYDTHPIEKLYPDEAFTFKTIVVGEPAYQALQANNVNTSDYDNVMRFLKSAEEGISNSNIKE